MNQELQDKKNLNAKATAFFDLREDNDRKKLKEMIMHLQHQLNIHEDR